MLRKDRKGVSVMIGYVLLIVIAVAVSILVYAWLQNYKPLEERACMDGVSLVIERASCNGAQIQYTIKNQGLFAIDGVQLRAGDKERIARDIINEDDGFVIHDITNGVVTLQPGETATYEYDFTPSTRINEFEAQAVLYDDNQPIICTNSLAVKDVECNSCFDDIVQDYLGEVVDEKVLPGGGQWGVGLPPTGAPAGLHVDWAEECENPPTIYAPEEVALETHIPALDISNVPAGTYNVYGTIERGGSYPCQDQELAHFETRISSAPPEPGPLLEDPNEEVQDDTPPGSCTQIITEEKLGTFNIDYGTSGFSIYMVSDAECTGYTPGIYNSVTLLDICVVEA